MEYSVDFPQLVSDLTSEELRHPMHQAWLESLLKPTKNLHQQFEAYVAAIKIRQRYTSETMVFEWALNNVFDPALRRIYIINNPGTPPWLSEFARSENEPDNMEYAMSEGQMYEFEHNAFEHAYSIGFVVHVPADLDYLEIAIRAFVESIKFALITYRIQYF